MIELNYPLGNVSSFDSLSVILSPDSNHLEEHGSCAGHKAPTAHLYWTHSYLLSSKIAQIIIIFFFYAVSCQSLAAFIGVSQYLRRQSS